MDVDGPNNRIFKYLTEEEIKAEEDEIDQFSLENEIILNGRIIKTYGELRPYIISSEIAEKFLDILEDEEYCYFYKWILFKELKELKKNKELEMKK
jgi:hypothetical protein